MAACDCCECEAGESDTSDYVASLDAFRSYLVALEFILGPNPLSCHVCGDLLPRRQCDGCGQNLCARCVCVCKRALSFPTTPTVHVRAICE